MTDINDDATDNVVTDNGKEDAVFGYNHIFRSMPTITPFAKDDNENGDTVGYDPNIGGDDLTDTEDPDVTDTDYTSLQGGTTNDDTSTNYITSSPPNKYILKPTKWSADDQISEGTGSAFFDTANTSVELKFAPAYNNANLQYYVDVKNGAYVEISSPTKTFIGNLDGSKFNMDTGGYMEIKGSNAPTIFQGVTFSVLGNSTLKFGSPLSQTQLDELSNINIRFGNPENGAPTLYIRPATDATKINLPNLSGFGTTTGASIKIAGAKRITSIAQDSSDSNKTVITTDNGKTITINGTFYSSGLYQQLNNGNLYISASSKNSLGSDATLFVTCYLAGDMVEMEDNKNCPVEKIQVGDRVAVYDPESLEKTYRTVIWVGKGHVTRQNQANIPLDQAGYPIRILKGAISENVPSKDMLITPEHCLFMQGHFIPARMLVNGRTVFYDTSLVDYDYYHLELEQHAIINVDGVLSESYLDTGNRYIFQNSQKVNGQQVSDQASDQVCGIAKMEVKTWDRDAAAPLETRREFVEPVFNLLQKRADSEGFTTHIDPDVVLTTETDIHLVTDKGITIPVRYKKHDSVIFLIPAGVRRVWIVSRTSRPCDVIGPFVDDRRWLGVLVGKITFVNEEQVHHLTDHFWRDSLKGWDVKENQPHRWTNGNAFLNLPVNPVMGADGFGKLSIQILAGGPYAKEVSRRPLEQFIA